MVYSNIVIGREYRRESVPPKQPVVGDEHVLHAILRILIGYIHLIIRLNDPIERGELYRLF